MICFKILPQGFTKCVDRDRASISELLVEIRDIIDEDLGLIVVINGRPIDDYGVVVSSSDEIVFVQEALGG